MVTLTETFHAGTFIVNELDNFQSRKEVTLSNANGETDVIFEAGSVLGKITNDNSDSLGADGSYVAIKKGQTDGSQTAAGVLYNEVILAAGATQKVTLMVHECVVRLSDLVWPSDFDSGDKTTALATLAGTPYFIQARAQEHDPD